MPPFAAWWQGLDTADRIELGLLSEEQAAEESASFERLRKALLRALRRGLLGRRKSEIPDVLRALTLFLGKSAAHLVLANLEDLWLETRPQNTPGTTTQRINWRRKARYGLEEMQQRDEVTSALADLGAARKRRKHDG
jgi:4-alpha-glucanotransferase